MPIRLGTNSPSSIRLGATEVTRAYLGSNLVYNASQPWTPSQLAGDLSVWYDAADASTISLSSNQVTSWDDKSGNARHATLVVGSPPTYTVGGQNGNNVVTFNGTGALRSSFAFVLGETVAIVAQRSNTDQPVVQRPSSNNRGVWGFAYPSFTTHRRYAVNGNSLITAPPDSAVTIPALVAQQELLAPSDFWSLGFGTPAYANLIGFIAEVVATDSFLGTADVQRLEGYLAHKWWGAGPANTLPANHPYKVSPPTV